MKKIATIQRSTAWPEPMYKAIRRQARKRKVPASAYIRYAVEQMLKADGEEVDNNIMWGGFRYTEEDLEDDEKELIGV